MMFPEKWVRDITEECGSGSSKGWTIGDVVKHPDGYDVEITGGSYWGDMGLSNFWCWRRVDTGETDHGYGW